MRLNADTPYIHTHTNRKELNERLFSKRTHKHIFREKRRCHTKYDCHPLKLIVYDYYTHQLSMGCFLLLFHTYIYWSGFRRLISNRQPTVFKVVFSCQYPNLIDSIYEILFLLFFFSLHSFIHFDKGKICSHVVFVNAE